MARKKAVSENVLKEQPPSASILREQQRAFLREQLASLERIGAMAEQLQRELAVALAMSACPRCGDRRCASWWDLSRPSEVPGIPAALRVQFDARCTERAEARKSAVRVCPHCGDPQCATVGGPTWCSPPYGRTGKQAAGGPRDA